MSYLEKNKVNHTKTHKKEVKDKDIEKETTKKGKQKKNDSTIEEINKIRELLKKLESM